MLRRELRYLGSLVLTRLLREVRFAFMRELMCSTSLITSPSSRALHTRTSAIRDWGRGSGEGIRLEQSADDFVCLLHGGSILAAQEMGDKPRQAIINPVLRCHRLAPQAPPPSFIAVACRRRASTAMVRVCEQTPPGRVVLMRAGAVGLDPMYSVGLGPMQALYHRRKCLCQTHERRRRPGGLKTDHECPGLIILPLAPMLNVTPMTPTTAGFGQRPLSRWGVWGYIPWAQKQVITPTKK